jgi:hypothetical protein
MPKFTTITGPSHWASYFINGDASGLEPGDQEKADAWLKRENVYIVGIAQEEDGTSVEPYFTNRMDIHAPECGCKGGTVIDYIAEVLPVGPSCPYPRQEGEDGPIVDLN